MRKYKVLLLILVIAAIRVSAQSYNNEWINYNQTYYKFKVATTGLFRINQSVLSAAGLGNTPAEQYQLWRNGQQVAIYTSIANGVFSTTDYIEFWGEKNDGKPDKALYRNASFQISDKVSLQTDTAAYFLTVNTITANNIRITDAANNVAANTLSAEPSFIHSIRFNFADKINRGFSQNVGQDLYSSSYDQGEMPSTRDISINNPYNFSINENLFFAGNNNIKLFAGVVGNASLSTSPRAISIALNNNTVYSDTVNDFNVKVDSATNINAANFSNNGTENFTVKLSNGTSNIYDRAVLSFVELQYSRTFNFGGKSNFAFTLPVSNNGNYLEITNFNWTSNPPVLYDFTNNKRYVANTATAGILKFALPAGGDRNFVLVSEENSNVNTVNQLVTRNFTNYSLSANQANYIIITGKALWTSATDYNSYRSSVPGGNYTAKLFDIDDLVDQFAFGIKKHPLSIKNFLQYAIKNFKSIKPKYAFLLGKGVVYDQYRANQSSAYADALNIVPTFGWPASDALLATAGNNVVPDIPIGRLSAITNKEVEDYLDKVKQYDAQAQSTIQTISSKLWMKEIIHINGADASDVGLQSSIDSYMGTYGGGWKSIIEAPLFGGHVNDFRKDNSGVTTLVSQRLSNLFNSGFSLLSYFGHSAATTLGYNLDDPATYNNTGKYPLFLINGCDAGSFYDYDTGRFTAKNALAELWVLAPQKGAIGFIASTHFGLTNYLDDFSTGFYTSLSRNGYNTGVGNNLLGGSNRLSAASNVDYFARIHAEEMVLHGDPAISVYADTLPDYVIEDPQVVINPSFISVARNSFSFKANIYNLGKATGDSVNLLITRKYPDGSTTILYNQKRGPINYMDSISLPNVPVIGTRDKGNNSITITIDNDNKFSELSELNNSVTKQFVVFEDEITPVYPYNYAIVNKPTTKFVASTADPLSTARQYTIEVDTTELFNSAFKVSQTVNSAIGGVVEFTPSFTMVDSTVYYWRIAIVPSTGSYRWNNSSFVYLANSPSMGYNQSHLFQHLKSSFQKINLDSTSRIWNFSNDTGLFHITHSIFPTSGSEPSDFQIKLNDIRVTANACLGHSIIFNLFDAKTLKPYYNQPVPSTNPQGSNYGYFMGSAASCDVANPTYGVEKNFEFGYMDSAARRKIAKFLDWIPAGVIVAARLILDQPVNANPYADIWKADAAVYGAGNTMYDKLKASGFADIDSFTSNNPRTWAFVYGKNVPSFTPVYKLTRGLTDQLFININIPYMGHAGTVSSPKFGPAKTWKRLKWFGSSLENLAGDIDTINLVGIDTSGKATLLNSFKTSVGDIDISAISAATYPYLMLTMNNVDTVFNTAYQLKYWRLLADLIPEGALAPGVKYSFNNTDTLQQGQQVNFAIAFKNISEMNYGDSINVKMQVIDNSNVTQDIKVAKLKPIIAGDTALVTATIDTKDLNGSNTLYLNVNPSNNPQEQYLFNNYLYKTFFVKNDNIKPVLEITFDGAHIMNGDIASAKPTIRVKLKDESKYLALDDTANIALQLIYPDNTVHSFSYGSDTLKFIPANLSTGVNEAIAELTPNLAMNGKYQLIVVGKDKNANLSGTIHYTLNFVVNNTPMISNVFNYPNPFTTSTAFVFTLTGSEIPSMIRIQILTITGKIIKEINKNELGPIHIGNNITEYKWDGTDMYGDKVANGVYLYRVITNLHGNQLEKYTPNDGSGNDTNTDHFFNSGYGKMYLMR
jgi:Peptidase family C25